MASIMVHRHRMMYNGGSNNLMMLNWHGHLMGGRFATYDSIESIMFVGSVVDHTMISIGIDQTVRSMYIVSVTGLVLLLNVAGVLVMHGI